MSSDMVNAKKLLRRMESKKSHSWWWDSHISPKNSKWLAENLEEMDQSVKRMLKLIDEEGDSFAKRAEMYYKKRPELVAHVEEFYRMYRALAERYDQVTGELRKSIPSDLDSQSSGVSDVGSEPAQTLPSPDAKTRRPKFGHRAAGFDVFLGSGGKKSDHHNKEDNTSSSSDSESEDSSINIYSGFPIDEEDDELRSKIAELEDELHNVKQELKTYQGYNKEHYTNGDNKSLLSKMEEYENQLRQSNRKIHIYEEQTRKLKLQLHKYGNVEDLDNFQSTQPDVEEANGNWLHMDMEFPEQELRVTALADELSKAKERLQNIEMENARLGHELKASNQAISSWENQLKLAQDDINMWKSKFNLENREVSKLQERIARYKTTLTEREQEVRELRRLVSVTEMNSHEKLELQSKVRVLVENLATAEDKLKENDLLCQELKKEIEEAEIQKAELTEATEVMKCQHKGEIERLNVEIAGRNEQIQALRSNMATLAAEMSAKEEELKELNNHMNELHMEHVELIGRADRAHKLAEKLKSRVVELENEVERLGTLVSESAEEKREAIRQLCLSIEHYRNDYHTLRQAFAGHKYKQRPAAMAA